MDGKLGIKQLEAATLSPKSSAWGFQWPQEKITSVSTYKHTLFFLSGRDSNHRTTENHKTTVLTAIEEEKKISTKLAENSNKIATKSLPTQYVRINFSLKG